MSAIFGIFNLDGRPVNLESLAGMQQAMAYWGPDGSATWSEGPVGLGHLMLYNTPESFHETMPLRSESGNLTLTAGARLDNRDDLYQALSVPSAEQTSMPDGALILKAYEKWGTDCAAHLLGDWVLAVWDARERQLFVARDHYGVTGLYYYQDNHMFAFASSLKGLLAVSDVPCRLNPTAVCGIGFRNAAETPYEGIHRLTPAQAMMVNAAGIDLWHHWHPNDVPKIRLGSDQAYLDAFLDIFTEAVRCRLRSHRAVGIMLSGGLDSGSIATLAAQELAESGQRLFAFSAIPTYDVTKTTPKNRCGDERPFIEATCRSAGNIDLTTLKAQKVTPLTALRRALDIHELPHANANYIWILDLLETAQRQQIGTMLDGWGGNFTISWAGNRAQYLLSLLKKGQWRTYFKEVNAWRNVNHLSFLEVVRSQVVKPLVQPIWPKWHERFDRRHRRIMNQAALRSFANNRHVSMGNYDAATGLNPGIHFYFRNGHTALFYEQSAMFGLELRQPAMDKRVIEFCLGIPQDQYTRNGQDRLLIRKAMAGLMPESVLWYKFRGFQSADIGQRILTHQAEIQMELQKLESSALARQFLDLTRMDDVFQNVQRRLDQTTALDCAILLQGLMNGLFLRRFEYGW